MSRIASGPGLCALALVVAGTAAAAGPSSASIAASSLGFAKPVYVDQHLAGGEPFVIRSSKGNLVYSAHEGDTHLLRDGVVKSPVGTTDFVVNQRNQVNMWTSADQGGTWQRVNLAGTGFFTNPIYNSGFSDPDLTEDEGGVIYNTGINLANDALFSSPDGGKTWPTGTISCHNGDRPWLAGGHANEVFMATDTAEGAGNGHTIFRSTNAGASCANAGISDNGAYHQGLYSGDGKLYYDHLDGSLIEPAVFTSSAGNVSGVGVSILPNASRAFDGTAPAKFTPHLAARSTMFAHWPAMAIDRANNLYVVWDTADRKAGTSGGCNGAATLLPNSIMMSSSTDHGRTWSKPLVVAHPGTTVLWPWIQAGANGAVSVVWYQYDRKTDPDCGAGHVYIKAATIFDATTTHAVIHRSFVVNRPIHEGGICQGGTGCVVSGQDRRLGDFLTNAVDPRGCVLVASADTTLLDPITKAQLPTARPIFVRQNRGMGLLGKPCGPA